MKRLISLYCRQAPQPIEPGRAVLLGSLFYGLWN